MTPLYGLAAIGAALAAATFRGNRDVCVYEKVSEREDGKHIGKTAAIPIEGTVPLVSSPMCAKSESLAKLMRDDRITEEQVLKGLTRGVIKQMRDAGGKVRFSEKESIYTPFVILKGRLGTGTRTLFIGGTDDPGFQRSGRAN